MNRRARGQVLGLLFLSGAAWAGDGLSLADDQALWPRWQARLNVATSQAGPGIQLGAAPGLHSAALLGDYYPQLSWLAPPAHWRGGLRATGGLFVGPLRPFAGLSDASISVSHSAIGDGLQRSDAEVWPYLGVGYTGLSRRSGWAFSADFGLTVRRPASVVGLARALVGSQSLDDAVREIRLAPTMLIGVHYAF